MEDSEGAAADPGASGTDGGDGGGTRGRRDVVVPLRLYKTVTVFSTLIAVVAVVLGFVLLDAATQGGSALQALAGLVLVGGAGVDAGVLAAWFDALQPAFAVGGLASIGLGAGVYILGSRFRTREMGKSQDDTDEPSGNG
jgi:hypothetical protein